MTGLMLVFLSGFSSARAESSLNCGNNLVSIGDSKAEVFKVCGEPAWRERYDEEWWQKEAEKGIRRGGSVAHEIWTYNFGPQRFMQDLHFENNRLVRIERGDYGYIVAPGQPRSCSPQVLEQKKTRAELLQACGEPFFKDERVETRLRSAGGVMRKFTVTVEEWTYDFGSTQFMRTVVIENGKVVDIRLGDHGG